MIYRFLRIDIDISIFTDENTDDFEPLVYDLVHV
jgi:hypothetical protein